jgi:hypothetical protein
MGRKVIQYGATVNTESWALVDESADDERAWEEELDHDRLLEEQADGLSGYVVEFIWTEEEFKKQYPDKYKELLELHAKKEE